ncbi:hypothetical protein [Streptomyces sp. NPDC049881]|uniref:hypothetical protein n=1 Tax=Streptomyces sp. NPDC049881 TaxID=3155778 RepID=UPI00344A7B25
MGGGSGTTYLVCGAAAYGARLAERAGAAGELARLADERAGADADALGLAGPDAPTVPWTADWRAEGAGDGDGLTELARAVAALPGPRLAVTGAAGTGKTSLAVLLTRELLRLPGPVPVHLSAASWDPALETLDTWLARRLAQEYGGCGDGLRRPATRRLVRDRLVLPVLDGIDELPPSTRDMALTGLRQALDGGAPLIVLLRPGTLADLAAPCAVLRAQPVDARAPRPAGPPGREADAARLARLLARLRTDEFAWWRVHRARRATVARGVLLALSAALPLLVPGAVYGVAGGLLAHLAFLSRDGQPRRPTALFGPRRPEPAAAVRAAVLLAVLPLLFLGGGAPVAVGAAACAALALAVGIPAEAGLAAGPVRLLRDERASALLTALFAAPVAAGLAAGHAPPAVGALAGAATALLLSPWCRWLTARTVLAATGALPWAVLAFLEEAARAGLLRRTGGAYVFRSAGPRPSADDATGHLRFTGHTGARVRRGQAALYVPLWTAAALGAAAAEGTWVWAAVALCLLLPPALDLLVVPLVRRPAELHLNGDWIAVVSRDRRLALAWADIAEVAVRGWEGARGGYEPMLHVRLAPGVVPGPGMRVADGGWVALWPLGRGGGPGEELAGALARFAGTRWTG